MARFKLTVTMGLVRCVRTQIFEVPDEDLENLTIGGKLYEEVVDAAAEAALYEVIDYDWERLPEGEAE